MFTVVCCLIAGLIASFVTGSVLQSRESYSFNIGFPSMLGGILFTAMLTLLAYMFPVQSAIVQMAAGVASVAAGVGGTFAARPLVMDILRRRNDTRLNDKGG